MSKVILATYESIDTAQQVVLDLLDNNFEREDIGYAVYDHNGKSRDENIVVPKSNTQESQIPAALLGAGGGFFVAMVSGVAPLLIAGSIGAVIGAVSGVSMIEVAERLRKTGMSEEEAHYSAERLKRGDALITVTTQTDNIEKAKEILLKHQPNDMEERRKQWLMDSDTDNSDPIIDPYVAEERTSD